MIDHEKPTKLTATPWSIMVTKMAKVTNMTKVANMESQTPQVHNLIAFVEFDQT